MPRKTTLLILLSILFGAMAYAQGIQQYKWKNRILLLVDKTIDSNKLQAQRDLFAAKSAELDERSMLIFLVTPYEVHFYDGQASKLVSPEIYKSLSISTEFTGVVLIGKDGGVKLKKNFEVKTDAIFSLIDGMPMRRSEMKRNNHK
jgi:hypothetical protein